MKRKVGDSGRGGGGGGGGRRCSLTVPRENRQRTGRSGRRVGQALEDEGSTAGKSRNTGRQLHDYVLLGCVRERATTPARLPPSSGLPKRPPPSSCPLPTTDLLRFVAAFPLRPRKLEALLRPPRHGRGLPNADVPRHGLPTDLVGLGQARGVLDDANEAEWKGDERPEQRKQREHHEGDHASQPPEGQQGLARGLRLVTGEGPMLMKVLQEGNRIGMGGLCVDFLGQVFAVLCNLGVLQHTPQSSSQLLGLCALQRHGMGSTAHLLQPLSPQEMISKEGHDDGWNACFQGIGHRACTAVVDGQLDLREQVRVRDSACHEQNIRVVLVLVNGGGCEHNGTLTAHADALKQSRNQRLAARDVDAAKTHVDGLALLQESSYVFGRRERLLREPEVAHCAGLLREIDGFWQERRAVTMDGWRRILGSPLGAWVEAMDGLQSKFCTGAVHWPCSKNPVEILNDLVTEKVDIACVRRRPLHQ
mmetsp:Transcript_110077/g.187371  ORF Transcript_110077/g.187371 Transcript_110077/m.187371 type:complete len:477 (+) Transcript_110077:633-2063(+)